MAVRVSFGVAVRPLSLLPWSPGVRLLLLLLLLPIRRLKNGKVAVFPSSSSLESASTAFSCKAARPSPPSMEDISLARLSRSSSDRPMRAMMSSTGFMCISRAH